MLNKPYVNSHLVIILLLGINLVSSGPGTLSSLSEKKESLDRLKRGDEDVCDQPEADAANEIASKAAEEAARAHDAQKPAGAKAAHQVKLDLAGKAEQAAKAAEAALAGKKQMVNQLQKELQDAVLVVDEEVNAYHEAEGFLRSAVAAAAKLSQVVKTLSFTIQIAQSSLESAEEVVQGSRQDLEEKADLLEAAKKRVELLKSQLDTCNKDLQSIKEAAQKAVNAAENAKEAAVASSPRCGPRQ